MRLYSRLEEEQTGRSVESGVTSTPSVVTGRGILSVQGTTLPKNSSVRRTHMSRPAHTQNTGNIPRITRPARIPARISSSLNVPSSKNFPSTYRHVRQPIRPMPCEVPSPYPFLLPEFPTLREHHLQVSNDTSSFSTHRQPH